MIDITDCQTGCLQAITANDLSARGIKRVTRFIVKINLHIGSTTAQIKAIAHDDIERAILVDIRNLDL